MVRGGGKGSLGEQREQEIQEAPAYVCRRKKVPDEPLPVLSQGPAFAPAPGVRRQNVELGTHTGTWHCFFLLSAGDPRSLPRQLDLKSQAVTGEGWPSLQEEAKRDFLGTQAMPGASLARSESQLSWHTVGFRSRVG